MFENKTEEERVLMVAVADGTPGSSFEEVKKSLAELSELVKTAGGVTVGEVIQNREARQPGT